MTGFLRVLKTNGHCSIQDLGRKTVQHLGFSASGAADEYAFLSANQLLGNNNNDAALEITFGQLTLLAEKDCTVALTGTDCLATLNNVTIKHWHVVHLSLGDTLVLQQPKQGLHSYLAVFGGIQSKLWLGSRSQTFNERALGFGEPFITKGSLLPLAAHCRQTSAKASSSHSTPNNINKAIPRYQHHQLTLRFIPHPLWAALSKNIQQMFLEQTFIISSDSNRMGYRLNGKGISLSKQDLKDNKLSKPVTYGAIQLPSNHELIVLMKERQTIGGYPVLGSVMQTDLWRLSQMRAGEKINFLPITIEQAQQQLHMFYQRFI